MKTAIRARLDRAALSDGCIARNARPLSASTRVAATVAAAASAHLLRTSLSAVMRGTRCVDLAAITANALRVRVTVRVPEGEVLRRAKRAG